MQKVLVIDEWTGRRFKITLPEIEAAVQRVNNAIMDTGEAPLNDLYDHLGLDTIPMGDTWGWAESVGARFSSRLVHKKRQIIPAVVFSFTVPKPFHRAFR